MDQSWFASPEKCALVVAYTPVSLACPEPIRCSVHRLLHNNANVLFPQTNGLQHLPTVPTKSFIHRMQKLFYAYLQPKMYHERNLGISNNPEKIAKYLAASDYPETEDLKILSYRDDELHNYCSFAPCCARTPELELVLD